MNFINLILHFGFAPHFVIQLALFKDFEGVLVLTHIYDKVFGFPLYPYI